MWVFRGERERGRVFQEPAAKEEKERELTVESLLRRIQEVKSVCDFPRFGHQFS